MFVGVIKRRSKGSGNAIARGKKAAGCFAPGINPTSSGCRQGTAELAFPA
jgi:hypothetical protein